MIRSPRPKTMRKRAVTLIAVLIAVLTLAACGTTEHTTRPDFSESTPRDRTPSGRTSSARMLDLRWVAPGPSNPEAIVADDRGAVAVGRYGDIVALDRRGQEQWTLAVAGEGEQTLRPLALSPDVAVVPVAPGRVLAVDRNRGEERWSTAIPDPAAVDVDPDHGSVVAVLTFKGLLFLLDSADGSARWSTQLAFGEQAGPVSVAVRSSRVVVAWGDVGGSHLRVFDADSGRALWSAVAPLFSGTPAVTADAVIVSENLEVVGRHVSARILRLDLATGAQVWAHRLDGPFLPQLRVTVGHDIAAVVNVPGNLSALDLETGSLHWSRQTRRRQYAAAPTLVGGVIAMPTYGTGLVAIAAADGSGVRNDAPGPVQTRVTFEGSSAVGRRLYLVGDRSRGEGEVWMLSASP